MSLENLGGPTPAPPAGSLVPNSFQNSIFPVATLTRNTLAVALPFRREFTSSDWPSGIQPMTNSDESRSPGMGKMAPPPIDHMPSFPLGPLTAILSPSGESAKPATPSGVIAVGFPVLTSTI